MGSREFLKMDKHNFLYLAVLIALVLVNTSQF